MASRKYANTRLDIGRKVREVKTGKVYEILDTFLTGHNFTLEPDGSNAVEYLWEEARCSRENPRGVFVDNEGFCKIQPDEYVLLGKDPEKLGD